MSTFNVLDIVLAKYSALTKIRWLFSVKIQIVPMGNLTQIKVCLGAASLEKDITATATKLTANRSIVKEEYFVIVDMPIAYGTANRDTTKNSHLMTTRGTLLKPSTFT